MADTQVEAPKFDPIAYQQKANADEAAQRNGTPVVPPVNTANTAIPAIPANGNPAIPAKPPAKEAVPPPPDTDEERDKRISRSDRRKLKFVEEAAHWRGKAEALEALLDKMGGKPESTPPSGTDDPEPQRAQYSTDAEYNRALGRWDARQESSKVVKQHAQTAEQQAALRSKVEAASAKFNKDMERFDDWKQVQEDAAKRYQSAVENDDPTQEITNGSTLEWLVLTSKQQAGVVYHWAKNPETLDEILAIKDEGDQIEAFRQLEGEVKVLYSSREPKSTKAAQAVEETLKDRTHPAEATAGRNSVERDAHKPRPSTEVAARGGSAPPDEPRIGSPAWHQRENERERANRGR